MQPLRRLATAAATANATDAMEKRIPGTATIAPSGYSVKVTGPVRDQRARARYKIDRMYFLRGWMPWGTFLSSAASATRHLLTTNISLQSRRSIAVALCLLHVASQNSIWRTLRATRIIYYRQHWRWWTNCTYCRLSSCIYRQSIHFVRCLEFAVSKSSRSR